ncbi:MAG: SPFH domain-containing protein [Gemmatimonadota bacterium]|nr:SPFH domain-containing protein [Gemmatimonadota bacterium]MDE2872532.1 SPFH domain-containing protein [Gemmatimonadota bacterium]
MPTPIAALIAGLVIVIAIVVLVATIKSLIVIAPPNRAAVLTGRNRLLTDGQRVGYRSISGGRVFRVPIIETVQHMNLETIPIEVSVSNAFSKGNIPLNVEAIANVKIASEPEWVFNNAVERLLGKTEEEIKALAQDTLTGNLRGVLATLTPEAVNEDRLGFAKALSEDAGEDLASLGFHLDVLKIQNVSDERGYLAAIGREKSAEAIRQAEIAEARKRADTREAQAEASRRAEVREAAAAIKVAEAKNELRVRQAELDREGETAEKIARVKAQEAEVEAEKVLEMKRVEREEQRLRADVVEPAKAAKMAAFARAEAEAAPILERGKAQVEVLRRLYGEVGAGGEAAFAVFIAEKLPELLETAVEAVRGVDIDRVVVMDGGGGEGVSNALNQRVKGAYGTMEGLASALGLDIRKVLRKAVGEES